MSLYAMTSKPPLVAARMATRTAAIFAALCALHIAVFALDGFWASSTKSPPPAAPSFLRFEFDAPATEAVPQTAAAAPAETLPEHAVSAEADAESDAQDAALTGGEPAAASGAMSESDYLALIMRRLEEKKVYPLAMRKRGIEGAMPVSFTIRADGTLARVQAEEHGAHPFLMQAALETVKSASPFPVLEREGGDFSVHVTIKYQLE